MRACIWALLSVIVWNLPALAQGAPVGPGPRLAESWSETWEPEIVVKSTRLGSADARALGRGAKWAIGGALLVGTLSAAVANALCERSAGCTGPTLTWGVLGAAVGAGVGGLIAEVTD